jgi:LDH2 family malate/lactate/ureidoglycolate dehydrogenase
VTAAGAGGLHAPVEALDGFCRAVLQAVGADAATTGAATAAMMHGSVHGVDSHGVRLLDHYARVLAGGRVNRRPRLRLEERHGAAATLDADHAHGALAAYRAMARAVEIAGEAGVGTVGIRNSSHFGPAGAFALAGAEAGCVAVVVCNSDSIVRLHDGAERFHGTNPLAVAAPVAGELPWLFDMATSAVPWNRVELLESLGLLLPESVASRADGSDTRAPGEAEMLAPLGGAFGFKGAGLAGAVEIFSAVLTGMRLGFELPPMGGPDFATPRGLGAFVLAVRPEAFVDRAVFDAGMRRYRAALRASAPRAGGRVLAPGDREWEEAARRRTAGVPIDPATASAFRRLAAEHGLALPFGSEDRP